MKPPGGPGPADSRPSSSSLALLDVGRRFGGAGYSRALPSTAPAPGPGQKKDECCLESGAGSVQLVAGRWLQLTGSRSCSVLVQPRTGTCLGLPLAKQPPGKGPILPSAECLRAVAAPVEQRHCSVQNFTELISVEETPFLCRHFCGQTSSQPPPALPGLEGGYFGVPVAPFVWTVN